MVMQGVDRREDFLTRFTARRADLLTWAVVLGSFVVGYAGYVYRSVFFYPDSRYYLAMAYLFGGESPEDARLLTEQALVGYGIPVPDADTLFGWGLVQPRVILPLLAAIPVRLFGPYGLVGVVLVINIVMTIVFTMILKRRFGNGAAIAVMLLINTSHYLQAFKGGALTESLSALWTALSLILAWKWIQSRSKWALIGLAATVIGSAFTRQATFIVAGAFAVAWILGSIKGRKNNAWMWPAIVTAVTALAAQVFQTIVFPTFSQAGQYMRMTETDNIVDAILATPKMVAGILVDETATFLRQDVSLLVFILLAIASMVIFWRREESHLLLGAVLGVALYNITNGNATQFRYAVPGLVFYALAVGLLVAYAVGALSAKKVELPAAKPTLKYESAAPEAVPAN